MVEKGEGGAAGSETANGQQQDRDKTRTRLPSTSELRDHFSLFPPQGLISFRRGQFSGTGKHLRCLLRFHNAILNPCSFYIVVSNMDTKKLWTSAIAGRWSGSRDQQRVIRFHKSSESMRFFGSCPPGRAGFSLLVILA